MKNMEITEVGRLLVLLFGFRFHRVSHGGRNVELLHQNANLLYHKVVVVLEDQRRHLVGDEVSIGTAGTVRVKPGLLDDLQRTARFLLQPDQVQRAVQLGVGGYHDRTVGASRGLQRVGPGVVAGVPVDRVQDRVEEADQVRSGVTAVPAVVVVEAPALEVKLDHATLETARATHPGFRIGEGSLGLRVMIMCLSVWG